VIVEWGVPETDGGAPLQGYNVAIRDEKKTMWIEVGRVNAEVQKFNIKDLQVLGVICKVKLTRTQNEEKSISIKSTRKFSLGLCYSKFAVNS